MISNNGVGPLERIQNRESHSAGIVGAPKICYCEEQARTLNEVLSRKI